MRKSRSLKYLFVTFALSTIQAAVKEIFRPNEVIGVTSLISHNGKAQHESQQSERVSTITFKSAHQHKRRWEQLLPTDLPFQCIMHANHLALWKEEKKNHHQQRQTPNLSQGLTQSLFTQEKNQWFHIKMSPPS
ncbi:hypothetical protein CDAR_108361 [Caerostris darwini]|uniref:Uncharacterized protein n=1 Tax=Caerostris darwini TaxID=1538125 RepID=A0AAV4PQ37_9ARAC|nr:hypothetical protein CDAR_108361 [Caerostris darwini]